MIQTHSNLGVLRLHCGINKLRPKLNPELNVARNRRHRSKAFDRIIIILLTISQDDLRATIERERERERERGRERERQKGRERNIRC